MNPACDIEQEGGRVAKLLMELQQAEATLAQEKKAVEEARETLHATQNAQEIIQLVAQSVQQKAHEKIAGVVSRCLSAVFDDPYEFNIEFNRKRGRTEAELQFIRRGLVVDPLSASGGGAVDIAAFALRVACLMLHRPRLSRILFLDEPFKFVSRQYQPAIRQMLEELASDLGLQIIMVSHSEELATGKIVEL